VQPEKYNSTTAPLPPYHKAGSSGAYGKLTRASFDAKFKIKKTIQGNSYLLGDFNVDKPVLYFER
jgi:hypothetical protein